MYWKPKANLFSAEKQSKGSDVVDLMFDSAIGTVEKPAAKLMYLLGPISSDAKLKLCLNPEQSNYQLPQIKVDIKMPELGLSLSKYQFHDFMLLLQALEYMARASAFRKYKARHQLENLPNYQVSFSCQILGYFLQATALISSLVYRLCSLFICLAFLLTRGWFFCCKVSRDPISLPIFSQMSP